MIEFAVLAVVLVGVLVLAHLDRQHHRRHVEHLLAAQDAERSEWSQQRWELLERIARPEVSLAPPSLLKPPSTPDPRDYFESAPEDEDESHLIGEAL